MQSTSDTSHDASRTGLPRARVFTSFETNREALTARRQLRRRDREAGRVSGRARGGHQAVAPGLVRALLVARPRTAVCQDQMFQSQRNLYSSDLFRYATVNIDSAAYRPGEDSVPLVVQVNESPTAARPGGARVRHRGLLPHLGGVDHA